MGVVVVVWANYLAEYNQTHTALRVKDTHTQPFSGPLSRTTRVSRVNQKGKTNVDFTEARDNEWQWHQLNHIQFCTSLQTDIHPSTPPLKFLQAGCPSWRPTNSVKALKITRVKDWSEHSAEHSVVPEWAPENMISLRGGEATTLDLSSRRSWPRSRSW